MSILRGYTVSLFTAIVPTKQYMYFYCHRSGHHSTNSATKKTLRAAKSQGITAFAMTEVSLLTV